MDVGDIPTDYVLAALILLASISVAVVSLDDGGAGMTDGTPLWMNASLEDVNSNETYTIAGFDEPVLVETFAVWCTTCTRQQQEVERLHEQRQDFVSVSLNTDPNEDVGLVRQHTRQNGFDWRYSVAPDRVVGSLVDEFGSSITVAPQAPMVLVCPDGSWKRLPSGVKPASQLDDLLDQGC